MKNIKPVERLDSLDAKIRTLIQSSGLDLSHVAKHSGMRHNYLKSYMENGATTLRVVEAERVLKTLGVKLTFFVCADKHLI